MEDFMNQKWLIAMLLGTLAAAPLGRLAADEEGPGGSGGQEEPGEFHHHGDHKRDQLQLTDEQKTKLQAVRDAQKKALQPLRRKQRDLVFKLKDQLDDKAGDSDIKATLAALKSTHDAIHDQMKRFIEQRQEILTPTQQARMLLRKIHGRDHRDGHEGFGMRPHHQDRDEGGGDGGMENKS
jgi:Spy/CpxP family protein refolding chaperone